MKKLASALIVLSLFLSGTALAADDSPAAPLPENAKHRKGVKARMKFEDCDKDKAGALTFEQVQECFPRMTRERFDAIDANKDGKITKEEIKAHRPARKKNRAAEQR